MSSPRLPLSSRPTFLPDEISRREFATVFRGYDPAEVRTFLNQLSEQAAENGDRVAEVQKAFSEMEEKAKNPELTEEMVTTLLGEQTAQILRSAREAANDVRSKADEEVGRNLRDAHEVTSRMKEEAETLLAERTDEAERLAETVRTDAAKDAEQMRTEAQEEAAAIRKEVASESERKRAELEADLIRIREQSEREITEERTRARQQSRDLIDTARAEAQALVERTEEKQTELIEGLVRKRKIALAQVEELRAGRQRLLKAYKLVRTTMDEVTTELERVEDEARQTASLAGQRAASTSELAPEEMDTVIELESYSLDDDVSPTVIDLVNEEGETPAMPSAQPAGSAAPFDFNAEVEALSEQQNDESQQNIVDLSDYTDARTGGDEGGSESSGGPLASAPLATLEREDTEQDTQQQQLTVVDAYEDDADDDVIDDEDDAPQSSHTSLIIGEAYVGGEGEEMDRALKLRRDAVVGKARSQAIRRLKRSLQDEQETLIARMRSGDGKSVQALLGSQEDHSATYHRVVVKLLREVVRTGASSVEGSTGVERGTIDRTGTAAARGLADELVNDLREQLQPVVEQLLETEELDVNEMQSRVAEPYRAVKGDYLDRLVEDRVGGVFDQGVAFARQGS